MHFHYYTIRINVLETSTKTNCSLVQREEHSNACKTPQAALGDALPETTFGFQISPGIKDNVLLLPLPYHTGL